MWYLDELWYFSPVISSVIIYIYIYRISLSDFLLFIGWSCWQQPEKKSKMAADEEGEKNGKKKRAKDGGEGAQTRTNFLQRSNVYLRKQFIWFGHKKKDYQLRCDICEDKTHFQFKKARKSHRIPNSRKKEKPHKTWVRSRFLSPLKISKLISANVTMFGSGSMYEFVTRSWFGFALLVWRQSWLFLPTKHLLVAYENTLYKWIS